MTVIESGGSTSRRELRHYLMRRRNERTAADRNADAMPVLLRMHPDTLSALLLDNDPLEQFAIDFEGKQFLGVPIVSDASMELWTVAADWPQVSVES